MLIIVEKNISEVISAISNGVVYRKVPTDFRFTPGLRKELIGSVHGVSFWIQSTSPYIVKCPQRYFKGTLFAKNDSSTEIRGKFFYPKSTIILNVIITVLLLPLLTQRDSLEIFYWLSVLLLWSTLGIGIIKFRKEEKRVVAFLESLSKEKE